MLGQDLPQQRQHVDLAHARVGLVATDLEPPVGEVVVAPQHRADRSPPAAEEPLGPPRVDGVSRGAAPRRWFVRRSRVAAIELAGGLEHNRDLLGAVEMHWPRFCDLQRRRLPPAGLRGRSAVVDRDGQDLREQVKCMLIERVDSGRSRRW